MVREKTNGAAAPLGATVSTGGVNFSVLADGPFDLYARAVAVPVFATLG